MSFINVTSNDPASPPPPSTPALTFGPTASSPDSLRTRDLDESPAGSLSGSLYFSNFDGSWGPHGSHESLSFDASPHHSSASSSISDLRLGSPLFPPGPLGPLQLCYHPGIGWHRTSSCRGFNSGLRDFREEESLWSTTSQFGSSDSSSPDQRPADLACWRHLRQNRFLRNESREALRDDPFEPHWCHTCRALYVFSRFSSPTSFHLAIGLFICSIKKPVHSPKNPHR